MPKPSHWKPYVPSTTQPWNADRVRHLHRRLGFGATAEELEHDLAAGFDGAIAAFLSVPPSSSRDSQKTHGAKPIRLQPQTAALANQAVHSNRVRLLKSACVMEMWHGQFPLREQLTLMWHNHFATSYLKVRDSDAMWAQFQLFRRHADGRFGDLLQSIVTDRATVLWLDGQVNRKEHPNENLARELMELFSLGVGNYTERDVREAARALTGWNVDDAGLHLDSNRHDTGMKTILGVTARHDAESLTNVLLQQDATSRRLAWRLCDHFLGQAVEQAALEQLAECLRAHELRITPALELLVKSERFFSASELNSRIRSPISFVVGGIRSLGLHREENDRPPVSPELAASWMASMGQDLFHPPGVAGWRGHKAWLGTASMIQRAAFAKALADGTLNRDHRRLDAALSLATPAAQLD